MKDRICIKCGQEMIPIKNGFVFEVDDELRTADLWGCRPCERYQIHGLPAAQSFAKIHGHLSSEEEEHLVADPGNDRFWAILDPAITYTSHFKRHMSEWYQGWEGF